MDATPLLPVLELSLLLQAYQSRLRRLADDIDPSWFDALAREDGFVPPSPDLAPLWRSALLRNRLRLGPVAPAAFTPPTHRLATLDKPALLVVLAARALYAHRAALARCVDGALLAGLRGFVGAPALAGLRAAGADAGPAEEDWRRHTTLLDWAVDGYARFERDGAWGDPTLRRLVQVVLPAGAVVHADGPADGPTGDSAALTALLPTLYPELAWLFG
jgi:hypothetical protein